MRSPVQAGLLCVTMKPMEEEQLFYAWLCGFIDGEGSFGLYKTMNGKVYAARMGITLRADDWRILQECRDRTDLGTITFRSRPGKTGNDRPQVNWYVLRATECAELICRLKAAGGLRAKKARDFALWEEAVTILRTQGGSTEGPGATRLAELKQALHDVKVWKDDVAAGYDQLQGVKALKKPHAPNRLMHYKKMNQQQVEEAILLCETMTQKEVAAKFNVSPITISRLIRGQYKRAPNSGRGQQRAKDVTVIEEIVSRYRSGEGPVALAREYGLDRSTIWRYINGKFDTRYHQPLN